jgi:hypothetical protein
MKIIYPIMYIDIRLLGPEMLSYTKSHSKMFLKFSVCNLIVYCVNSNFLDPLIFAFSIKLFQAATPLKWEWH